MKTTLPAAVYLRKSRAEQSDDLAKTLEKHRQLLCEYAENNAIDIVDIYEEVVSGESLYARPQMLKLLEHVELGRYSAVLCVDLDRLGRGGMRDQGIILDTFKHAQTIIITPEKTYNLNDESDEELTELKTFISRRELKLINKRLRRGLLQTVKNGGYVSNAPYGYKNVEVDKKPTLEVVETEGFFVKLIFQLYTDEGLGCTAIAAKVNGMGAKPRRAEQFGRSSILGILKNPVYMGVVAYNRTEQTVRASGQPKKVTTRAPDEQIVVSGLHPALIDPKTFKRAAAILKKRGHPPTNSGKIKNSLAGLVVCQNCGKTMQRTTANKQKTAYLTCPTKGCVPATRFALAEAAVVNYLNETLLQKEFSLPTAVVNVGETSLSGESTELQKLLKNAENKLQNIYLFYENGSYTAEEFLARKSALQGEAEALKQRLHDVESQKSKTASFQKKKAKRYDNFADFYHSLKPAEQNKLLKSLLKRVSYSKEKGSEASKFTLEMMLLEQ